MDIIIIEDEYAASTHLKKLLTQLKHNINILAILESVEDSINWLKNSGEPDLIFSDIQLSDGLSFEIFKKIQVQNPVIFTTAFDQYAIQAFKVNSIDYLLKPIQLADLQQSLQKYDQLAAKYSALPTSNLEALLSQLSTKQPSFKSRFLIKTGQAMRSISINHIMYFFIERQLVHLRLKDGKSYFLDHSLDELESMLDPSIYFRVNRQMIVSISSIKSIQSYFNNRLFLTLNPAHSTNVIVSREKVAAFKKWLDR